MQVSWLDRLLIGIAPQWGLRRVRARAAAQLVARHFEAASGGRRTSGWRRSSSDANVANGPALAALRELSRDLRRNNGWAKRGIQAIVNNTVGWGILPKPDDRSRRRAEQAIALWNAWASSTSCDYDGRLSFYGLQRLAMETIAESGEVLIVRQPAATRDGLAIPLRLQVLEPDYLDTSRDGMIGESGGPVIQGVEFDKQGRRVAYWLFGAHPGGAGLATTLGSSLTSTRWPAERVMHIYRVDRPGQIRGVPWLASAITRLKDFDDFEDAELMQQKVAACFGAFVTDNGDPTVSALGQPTTGLNGEQLEQIEPGHIAYLPPGKTVQFSTPPSVQDSAFTARALRRIAVSLGVTYEELSGDYCVAPETRVLRADLRWVRADDLLEGTEIVAFDEDVPGGRGGRRKWRKAFVVRTGRRNLNRRRIVTDGAVVTVSDEHLFLCTSRAPSGAARGNGIQARSENPGDPGRGQRWVRADRLQPGDQIVFLCSPWQEGRTHQHGYLKGIADGEGWVDVHDAKIGIAQNPGPVLDEIGETLADLGFTASLHGANGGHKVQQWSITGIGECLRFLGEIRPTRLLQHADRIYNGRMVAGGSRKTGRPTAVTVLAVGDLGVGPVVTLETSTRTLLTEGLCSHNSHVNFSSARMARLAHWQNVHEWRWHMIIPQLCDGAWRWAMELAVELNGWPAVPRAQWAAPPMPILEPDKEGLAYQRLVRIGAMTWGQMVRELGEDPVAQLDEIQAFNKELDDRGIVLDCDPRRTNSSGQKQSPDAEQEDSAPDAAGTDSDSDPADPAGTEPASDSAESGGDDTDEPADTKSPAADSSETET